MIKTLLILCTIFSSCSHDYEGMENPEWLQHDYLYAPFKITSNTLEAEIFDKKYFLTESNSKSSLRSVVYTVSIKEGIFIFFKTSDSTVSLTFRTDGKEYLIGNYTRNN